MSNGIKDLATAGVPPPDVGGVGEPSDLEPRDTLWQKITDSVDALDADTRQRVATELDRHGLGELLTIARPIRVERRDHREVWGRRIAETAIKLHG